MLNRMDIVELWYECGFNVIEPPIIHLSLTDEGLDKLNKTINEYGTQGEIQLPEEDKYEEFKKWFKGQDKYLMRNAGDDVFCSCEVVFKEFEHEQEEKRKERRIKIVIDCALGIQGCCNPKKFTDKIYNELKGEGLLK